MRYKLFTLSVINQLYMIGFYYLLDRMLNNMKFRFHFNCCTYYISASSHCAVQNERLLDDPCHHNVMTCMSIIRYFHDPSAPILIALILRSFIYCSHWWMWKARMDISFNFISSSRSDVWHTSCAPHSDAADKIFPMVDLSNGVDVAVPTNSSWENVPERYLQLSAYSITHRGVNKKSIIGQTKKRAAVRRCPRF